MNFGIKIIFSFILSILFFLVYYKYFKSYEAKYDEKLLHKLKNNEYRFIAHAGGGIDNLKYTNSLEAIEYSIANDYKMIEIDIRETLDKVFVGVHDWKEFHEITKKNNDDTIDNFVLTHKEFKKKKIYDRYTPLDIDKINKIFDSNSELILITDKSNNFKKIITDFKFDHRRIMVEIFGKKKYFNAIKQGIINPVYSFNHKDYDFVIKHKIKIVAAHSQDIINNSSVYKKLIKKGVLVFMFSSNEEEFIIKNLDILFTHVYTDFWDVKFSKCKSNTCDTY